MRKNKTKMQLPRYGHLLDLFLFCAVITGTLFGQFVETKIVPDDALVSDAFGQEVAMYGSFAAISALHSDAAAFGAGAVYVYKHNGNSWVFHSKLTASDATGGDNFGSSVAMFQNYMIVGAYGDMDLQRRSGSAYIFRLQSDNWIEEAKLWADDGTTGDRFGWSVGISSDHAIVGARSADHDGPGAGAAYIYVRNKNVWTEQQKIVGSGIADFDWFGGSVAIHKNLAIVGAISDEHNGVETGTAYIFKLEGESWIEHVKLSASDGNYRDFFGHAVTINDNYAVVGARGRDEYSFDIGAVYIYKRNHDGWIEETILTASDGYADDQFGSSVSLIGDQLIIGAWGDQTDQYSEYDSGSAYIFKRQGTAWMEVAKILPSDPAEGDQFGSQVAMFGQHILIGTDLKDAIKPGAAYFYSYDKTGKNRDISVQKLPKTIALNPNYPNPFNPSTTIQYSMIKESMVTLKVYNLNGQVVKTLVNESKSFGTHSAVWDGRDQAGNPVASGIYMYRLETGGKVLTRKMFLAK